jgi:hypothetical protein
MKKYMVTKKNSKAHQQHLTNKLLKRVGYKQVERQSSVEWQNEYAASLKSYPDERSTHIPGNGLKKDNSGLIDIATKNYTSAPAYNKGPYMVVSKNEIKHIGRK